MCAIGLAPSLSGPAMAFSTEDRPALGQTSLLEAARLMLSVDYPYIPRGIGYIYVITK